MNKLVNIPSYIEDPNYRYKMPKFQLKIEGKGNGIKTNIVNLLDVSKALRMPPEYLLKFMGHELGSQTTCKGKGNDIDYIINGSFTDPEIKTMIDKFIEKYVICEKCTYPEISLKIKGQEIYGNCSACGNIAKLDSLHKVAAYILKNPPTKVKGDIKEKQKEPTKRGGKEKEEEITKENQKKIDQKKKRQMEEAKIEDDLLSDDEKKRLEEKNKKKAMISRAQKLTVDSADLQQYIKDLNAQFTEIKEQTPEETQKLQNLLASFDIPAQCRDRVSFVIFNALFDINIAQNISKLAPLILNLFKSQLIQDIEAQTLANLQYFLMEKFKQSNEQTTDFKQYIPTILKMFYDEDLITEEFLLEWNEGNCPDLKKNFLYNELHDAQFKAASQQIIEWLKTSEDE